MSNKPPRKPIDGDVSSRHPASAVKAPRAAAKEGREARLADALRANLRRRKKEPGDSVAKEPAENDVET